MSLICEAVDLRLGSEICLCWEGLTRFLGDGRIETDGNAIERSIRPNALNRKNALFAGSDSGAQGQSPLRSLKPASSGVEPLHYLADVLTRIVNGYPNSRIDDGPTVEPLSSRQWPEKTAYSSSTDP